MNQSKLEDGFNMRIFVITLSVFLLVVYGFFNAKDLILGPKIEIFNPVQNLETTNNTIIISGRAQNTAFISLNQKPIQVDKQGLFQEKLLLSPGSNIIEIKAKDRFNKEVLKSLNIYYKQI